PTGLASSRRRGIASGAAAAMNRAPDSVRPKTMPRLLEEASPVGLSVAVTNEDERNTFTFT
ncbi:MAG: hypothetical protein AAGK93_10785, partial [Pseudomonadota bacterium]